jgi:hypothetical protein
VEIATLTWFFSALAAPVAVPFFVLVAATNRWVFVVSAVGLAIGATLLFGYWADGLDAPAGMALLYLVPAAFAGWLAGGVAWLARAIRGRSGNPSWKQAAVLYLLAAIFAATFTYPWR